MRNRLKTLGGLADGGVLRRFPVIAAALYLALVQILSAAHAESGLANAPDHDGAACVLCLTAHGAGHGLAAGETRLPAPAQASFAVALLAPLGLAPTHAPAPSPRGPPRN